MIVFCDVDVADTTRLAHDVEESVHEVVVCGSLSDVFGRRVVESVGMVAADPGSAPGSWSLRATAPTST